MQLPLWLKLVEVILLAVIIGGIFAALHEQAHASIDEYYGCSNITIRWGAKNESAFLLTQADCTAVPDSYQPSLIAAHGINEAITNNVTIPLYFIFMMIAWIYILKEN